MKAHRKTEPQTTIADEFDYKGVHVKIEEWRDRSDIEYVVHSYDCVYVSPSDSLKVTRATIIKTIDEMDAS
jgi:hypothetical protein